MNRRRSRTDRRGFLVLAGSVTAGTVGLAGCADEGEEEEPAGEDDGLDDPEDHDEAEGDDPDTTDRDDEAGNTTGEEEDA
jgi:hypothetical protein